MAKGMKVAPDKLAGAKRIMAAMLGMKPKPHEEMKLSSKKKANGPKDRPVNKRAKERRK